MRGLNSKSEEVQPNAIVTEILDAPSWLLLRIWDFFRFSAFWLPICALSGCVTIWLAALPLASSGATNELPRGDHHFQYTNHVVDDVPWSIHIVKLERSHPGFEFCTTLGKGDVFGMSTVSEQ